MQQTKLVHDEISIPQRNRKRSIKKTAKTSESTQKGEIRKDAIGMKRPKQDSSR